jgi:phage tail-like protein
VTDTYRPFTIRRTIGGDVVRATTGWHGALRYGPVPVSFDIVNGTSLDGIPIGYDSTLVTVRVPPTVPWAEAVLVRGAFGPPTTPLDGVAVWYTDGHDPEAADQYNQQVRDQPLTGGYWYYYTLFLCVQPEPGLPCSWLASAMGAVLVPRNYHAADKLFALIPQFYQSTDDQQAPDGRTGPLRKFTAILGYDNDYERTLLDGVLNVYNPDTAPLRFIQLLGSNLGLPIEQALGGARYRMLVGSLNDLENLRGTSLGLQAFVYAASNYRCDVVRGTNQLLTVDDAEFAAGVGHWQTFTNPLVTTIKNYFSSISPPANAYTYVQVQQYGGSSSPPLPLMAGAGQRIFEVIENAKTGTAGQPGTLLGGPYANLTALQTATPPVMPYPSTAWFSGDYVVLGDSSHASWNGTTWVAGPGVAVRPAISGVQAGAPGSFLPATAQIPANFAAMPATTLALPYTGWSSGQYVALGDGSHAYLAQNPTTGALTWAVGNASLPTTTATSAAVPTAGTPGVWYAGATQVAAPATLAALKAISPMPTPSGTLPLNPTTQFMVLGDNTKVSFLGFYRSGTVSANPDYPMTRQESVPVLNSQTDTVWPEYTRAAGATAQASLAHTTTINQSTYNAIPMPPGWSRVPFTQAGATLGALSAVGVTGVQSSVAASYMVDGIVISYPPTGSTTTSYWPALPDGAKLALRINGVEWAHVGIGPGEIYPSGAFSLTFAADVPFPANQPVELWFFNPGASALNIGGTNSSFTVFPYLFARPLTALVPAGSPDTGAAAWVCPVTDKYYLHGHVEYYIVNGDWFIWVNNKPVAYGTWAGTKMDVSVAMALTAGDLVEWGAYHGYAPHSYYSNRTPGVSPRFEIYRWGAI